MIEKEILRKEYIKIRKEILFEERTVLDKKIRDEVLKTEQFRKAGLILIYVSTKNEVDTIEIINECLKIGKKVAVPKCNINEMEFHYITNLNELETSNFGIQEPKEQKKVLNFNNSICIIPGLAFDEEGNRLGYGKGYYDRFLKNYYQYKIGLCYPQCFCEKLPTDQFDIKVDMCLGKLICKKTYLGGENGKYNRS